MAKEKLKFVAQPWATGNSTVITIPFQVALLLIPEMDYEISMKKKGD